MDVVDDNPCPQVNSGGPAETQVNRELLDGIRSVKVARV